MGILVRLHCRCRRPDSGHHLAAGDVRSRNSGEEGEEAATAYWESEASHEVATSRPQPGKDPKQEPGTSIHHARHSAGNPGHGLVPCISLRSYVSCVSGCPSFDEAQLIRIWSLHLCASL